MLFLHRNSIHILQIFLETVHTIAHTQLEQKCLVVKHYQQRVTSTITIAGISSNIRRMRKGFRDRTRDDLEGSTCIMLHNTLGARQQE
jgi:hypothetical protein